MLAETLQELIIERYVEAIKQVAKKKTKKEGKRKTLIHLRKFIRMKRKAGKELKKSKNALSEKIKEITRKIRLADLGIQNTARQKQEKEENRPMKGSEVKLNCFTLMLGRSLVIGILLGLL